MPGKSTKRSLLAALALLLVGIAVASGWLAGWPVRSAADRLQLPAGQVADETQTTCENESVWMLKVCLEPAVPVAPPTQAIGAPYEVVVPTPEQLP